MSHSKLELKNKLEKINKNIDDEKKKEKIDYNVIRANNLLRVKYNNELVKKLLEELELSL